MIKMESSDEESHIFDLSDDEIKIRIIEMQNYTFIYDKSDPLHCDRDNKIQVYETIGALLGLVSIAMIQQGKHMKNIIY